MSGNIELQPTAYVNSRGNLSQSSRVKISENMIDPDLTTNALMKQADGLVTLV